MNSISNVSLENTLTLIQLAREAALAKGQEQQANRLAPVAEEMRKVVATSRQTPASPAAPAGILGQSDFQRMLEASQVKPETSVQPSTASQVVDRSRMVGAMASSGMSELDIARQLGMTRDEVKLILNVQNRGMRIGEVWK